MNITIPPNPHDDRVNILIQTDSGQKMVSDVKTYSGLTARMMSALGKAELTTVTLTDGNKKNLYINKRSLAKHILMEENGDVRRITTAAKDALASKLFATKEKGHANEALTLDAVNQQTVEELKLGLYECSSDESQKVLGKTNFTKHDLKRASDKEKIDLRDLTQADMETAELQPKYQMKVKNQTFFLSKLFTLSSRSTPYAAIAYVQDPKNKGHYVPRLLYLSEANNIWRCAPVMQGQMSGAINAGKGITRLNPDKSQGPAIKDSTTVPSELNKALFDLLTPKLHAVVEIENDTSEEQLTRNHSIFVSVPSRTYGEENINSNEEFRAVVAKPRVFDMTKTISPHDAPDFKKGVKEHYKIPGTNSEDVEVYTVLSANKNYEYVFYESRCFGYNSKLGMNQWQETEPHAWLASVQYVGSRQKVNTFLTYTESLDPGLGTLSGADRPSYLPEDFDRNTLFEEDIDPRSLKEEDVERRNREINSKLEAAEQVITQKVEATRSQISAAITEAVTEDKENGLKSLRSVVKKEYDDGKKTLEEAVARETDFRISDEIRRQKKQEAEKLQKETLVYITPVQNRMPNQCQVVPTWKYRKDFPVLKQFQQWRAETSKTDIDNEDSVQTTV